MIRWNLRVKDTQEWEQVGKSQLFYSIFNDFIAFFETTKMHKSTGKLSKIINVAKLNAHRPLITITQSTEYEWHMENIVSHSWHKICPIRWTSDVLARHCIFFVQTLKMPITHSFRRKQRKIQIITLVTFVLRWNYSKSWSIKNFEILEKKNLFTALVVEAYRVMLFTPLLDQKWAKALRLTFALVFWDYPTGNPKKSWCPTRGCVPLVG